MTVLRRRWVALGEQSKHNLEHRWGYRQRQRLRDYGAGIVMAFPPWVAAKLFFDFHGEMFRTMYLPQLQGHSTEPLPGKAIRAFRFECAADLTTGLPVAESI